jgi:hypothetical protein|tara:strand:- start:3688 stop:4458 length:771 start_codon:yes stop_codon:yes gene_type:complete
MAPFASNLFDKGFSALTIDTGTGIVALLFLDEVRRRIKHFGSHALYINAVLGCGAGASIGLLLLLSAAQFASCMILVLPSLYRLMGTAIPSLALGSTALVELMLYHGFRDWEIFFKVCVLEACLFMVALLRRDAKARSEAIGIPVAGTALAIEAYIRKKCTIVHTALVCPPLAMAVLLWALTFYRFWKDSGTTFEMQRTSFTLCMAECGLLAFLAGQDRSPSYYVLERSRQALKDAYRFAHVRVYGIPPRGFKKNF